MPSSCNPNQRTAASLGAHKPVHIQMRFLFKFPYPVLACIPLHLPMYAVDDLPTRIVTASRQETVLFQTPWTASTFSEENLLQKHYRTLPQALREIPGVLVQETSMGQGSPYIRGFTGFRNLMLIDGIRLNNSVFRSGPNQYWNTVDPLGIGRMEIVKSTGSVPYGPDSIGGTVQVFTRNPGNAPEQRAYLRASSAHRSLLGRLETTQILSDRTSILLGGGGKTYGDLEGGRDLGRQTGTGYEEQNFDIKIRHQLSDNARLTLFHQHLRQNNVPRTHKTIHAKSFAGTSLGEELRRDLDQERNLTYLQYNRDLDGELADSLFFSFSWQEQNEVRDRVKASSTELQGVDVGSLGIILQTNGESALGNWTTGFDYYGDNVDSFKTKNNIAAIQGPVGDDASYDLLGAYANIESPLADRTTLTLGGRYTFAKAQAGRVEDPVAGNIISIADEWDAVVGSARLSREIVQGSVFLFGGIAQGFRAPNISDLTRLDSARTNEIETPSPNLKPEHFLTQELGLRYRKDKFSFAVSLFHTDIKDMIVPTPTGNVIDGENEVTKVNAGDGFTEGIELAATYEPDDHWLIWANFSWLDGEVETYPTSTATKVREPIDRLMPLTWQLGTRWTCEACHFHIEGLIRAAQIADQLSTRDHADTSRIPPGGTPGFSVFDLRAAWQMDASTEITLAIENLLDEDYRIHGSGTNMPGRNFIFAVNKTF
jgi:hemoglobin/transferrin/lactoferrin receptor protein